MELPNFNQGWSPAKKALYWDYKGDWDRAHDCVDSLSGKVAAHVHAYLHRKEGDKWNAGYWYNRAGKDFPSISLEEEWQVLWKEYGR